MKTSTTTIEVIDWREGIFESGDYSIPRKYKVKGNIHEIYKHGYYLKSGNFIDTTHSCINVENNIILGCTLVIKP
jgi:hypothetical protein